MLKENVITGLIILAVVPLIWRLGRPPRSGSPSGGLPTVGGRRIRADHRVHRRGIAALPARRRARPLRPGRPAPLAVHSWSMTQRPRPRTAELLDLAPHPEGGWYRETWRAGPASHPGGYPGPRAAATGIYFLLAPGEESRWHRVRSDEVWLWHAGGPLLMLDGGDGDRPSGHPEATTLGRASRRARSRSTSFRAVTGRPPARPPAKRSWSAAWWRRASTSRTSPCTKRKETLLGAGA